MVELLLQWIPRPYVCASYMTNPPVNGVIIPMAVIIDTRHCVLLEHDEQCIVTVKWFTPRQVANMSEDIPW